MLSATDRHYRALLSLTAEDTHNLQRAADAAIVDYACAVVDELSFSLRNRKRSKHLSLQHVIAHASLVRCCFERGDDACECARIIVGRGNP